MLSRGRGRDMPSPKRFILFLTEDAIELGARRGDLILHHGLERLRVGEDDAVLQELRASGAAEGRLVRPSLVEGRATSMPFSIPSSWPLETFQPMVRTWPILFRLVIARSACSAPMSTFSINCTSGLADRKVR